MNRYVQENHPCFQRLFERLVEQAWNVIRQNVMHEYINNISNICNQTMVDKVHGDKDFDTHMDYIYYPNESFLYQKEI